MIGRTCCSYHAGDWRVVNRHALRLLQLADTADVDSEDIADHVAAAAGGRGPHRLGVEAMSSLFHDPIEVEDDQPPVYVNGQHRIQAMRDAGVGTTITGRHEQVEDNARS